ncbi:MAG: DUF4177 domain-containing protein [Gemmobacter sp.]
MATYEYRVVPAPRRAGKVKGAKTVPDRFAGTLARVMNDLGAEGWEYLRADTLPIEERVGLTGRTTSFHTLLVFRRALSAPAAEPAAERLATELAPDTADLPPPAPEGAPADAAAALPEPDALDLAARRAAALSLASRTVFGKTPKLSAVPGPGQAPSVGPAVPPREPGRD